MGMGVGRNLGWRWVSGAAPYRVRGRPGEECDWVVVAEGQLVYVRFVLLVNIPCLSQLKTYKESSERHRYRGGTLVELARICESGPPRFHLLFPAFSGKW